MDLQEEGDGLCCIDAFSHHQGLRPAACHGAEILHGTMDGGSPLPEEILDCAQIGNNDVEASPCRGNPRGDRVPEVHPSNAPWT